jgi:hypothetical protein
MRFCNRYASISFVEKRLYKQLLNPVGRMGSFRFRAILVPVCKKTVRKEFAAIMVAVLSQLSYEVREMLLFGGRHPAIDFP